MMFVVPQPDWPIFTANDTYDDLVETISNLNDTAKAMRRRGYTGVASDGYARQHARINAVLDELAGR